MKQPLRTNAVLFSILSLTLVSCSKSPKSNAGPDAQNNPEMQQELSGFGDVYRATENSLDLISSTSDAGSLIYQFDADASADLLISDDPGNVTLSSTFGAIALSGEVSGTTSETWSTTLEAGSWAVRYDPTGSEDNQQALAFVRFTESRYFLEVEKSSRVLPNGRDILLRAYVTKNAEVNEFGALANGELVIAEETQISVTVTMPDNQITETVLADNGQIAQGDLVVGDGVFSTLLNWTTAGNYELNIRAQANVAGNLVQRNLNLHDNLSGFRAQLAHETTEAVAGRVFEQNLSEGQYAVPLVVTFDNSAVPDYVSVLAEIWATDNVGEQVRIVDHITGLLHPEDLGDGTHGLPLLIQSDDVPDATGRFASVELRIIQLSDIDNGDEILYGVREIGVSGLPQ